MAVIKVFTMIPGLIFNVIGRVIRVIPVFAGLFGCIYETAGTIILYPLRFLNYLINFLYRGSLPFSRTLWSIKQLIQDVYEEGYHVLIQYIPSYLKPYAYLILKIVKIVVELVRFISILVPQIWNYGFALAFWYTIGAQYLLYIEENPSRANDTVEVFVRAFGLVLNTFIGAGNVFVTVYDVVLPVYWQLVWFSYQYGYLLVQYIGHALGLVPSLKYFTYYDPFNDIARTFILPQQDIALGSTQLKTEIKRKLEHVVPHLLWESTDETLNVELRHFRRQLVSISDNPVFSRLSPNPTYNLGASSAAIAQTVLIVLVRGFEVAGDLAYILLEIFLIFLSLFSTVIIPFFSLIPKFACSVKNFNCALKEAGIGVLEDFIDAVQLEVITGPITIPGCTPQELGDVPCTCSVEEGGIFRSLPPCQTNQYTCLVQPGENGVLFYAENKNGETSTITRSADPRLGCPNSYNTINPTRRLLSMPKCHNTCITFESTPIHTEGWEFKICDQEKYFIGHCVVRGGVITYDDRKRKLVGEVSFNKIYMEKLKSISPPGFDYKHAKDIPVEKPKYTKPRYTKIETVINSLSSFSSINDGFIQDICGDMKTSDFSMSPDVKYSQVAQMTICTLRAFMKGGNTKRRKMEGDVIKVPDLDDLYIGPKEEGPEPEKPMKSAIHFYLQPFMDMSHSVLRQHRNPLQTIEIFHLSLIDAHKAYIKQFNPDHLSPVGSTRGLLPMLVTQLSNAYLNKSIEDMKEYAERVELGHNIDFVTINREHSLGYYRRQMLSNAYDSGRLVSICGFNGYSCPDGTCAPNGDPRKCQACQDYTTSCILKSIPHAVNTGFEGIDIAFLFTGIGECWRDITLNPSKSPLQAFIDGKIKIFGTDPITWPPELRFCFPLFIPLPVIPSFTWSYLKFIAQICSSNTVLNGNVGTCICEQYGSQEDVGDIYSQYVVGVPNASVVRLRKSFVAISFLFSRFVPTWLSDIWISIITFFFCLPEQCPQIAYLFDYEYNNFGNSEAVNIICFFINSMSLLYSYLFFYVPLAILFLYGRKLAWEVASLGTDILQYIVKGIFDYLHSINAKYVVEDYGEHARVVGEERETRVDIKEPLLDKDPNV